MMWSFFMAQQSSTEKTPGDWGYANWSYWICGEKDLITQVDEMDVEPSWGSVWCVQWSQGGLGEGHLQLKRSRKKLTAAIISVLREDGKKTNPFSLLSAIITDKFFGLDWREELHCLEVVNEERACLTVRIRRPTDGCYICCARGQLSGGQRLSVSFETGLGNSFCYLDETRMAQILNNDMSNPHLPLSES